MEYRLASGRDVLNGFIGRKYPGCFLCNKLILGFYYLFTFAIDYYKILLIKSNNGLQCVVIITRPIFSSVEGVNVKI